MNSYFLGDREWFPDVGKIAYEGPSTDNPLAFRYYDPARIIGGASMESQLKFAVAYWHSFRADGSDPFGLPTMERPWDRDRTPMDAAEARLDAAFEFFTKLGVRHYCFHDRDLAPEGETPQESERFLFRIVELAKARQASTGVGPLWGTANLFSHPRYMNGAATNPDFMVLSYAAAQVKAAIDATMELGGSGFVFWGGREGYGSLLNTDLAREKDHLALFLASARDYARSRGFRGSFYIEPKPMEPTKHQYDFDVESVAGFLKRYGLDGDFRVNIEANHAELAGHDFHHEVRTALSLGLFGSIDANRGDPRNGWDTDQFPKDAYETTLVMHAILKAGGFGDGGLNFDAKLRRNSTAPEDLFEAHIGGMDAFAIGLLAARRLLDGGELESALEERYGSFSRGRAAAFERGELGLAELAALAAADPGLGMASGRQEHLENIVNRAIQDALRS